METATGPIALAKSILRTMISKCAALQSWDGFTFSESELFDRVYLDALPAPPDFKPEYTREQIEAFRPFVLVYMPPVAGFSMTANSAGSVCGASAAGSFIVELHRNVKPDEALDPGAVDRSFENTIGRLCSTNDMAAPGLWQLSRYSTYLELRAVELLEVYRAHPDDVPSKGDFQIATLLVQWGTL